MRYLHPKIYLLTLQNIFWSLENTDVYSALCFDCLHAYGGLFKDHLLVQYKEVVDSLDNLRHDAKMIDTQFVSLACSARLCELIVVL